MRSNRYLWWFIAVWSASFVFFHLYTAAFGTLVTHLQRSVHLTFAVVLGFLVYPLTKGKKPGILELILALFGLICFGYIAYNYEEITVRQTLVDPLSFLDLIIGGLGVLLILEITRRTTGAALSIVAIIFLAYAFLGPYFPDMIAHRGVSLIDLIDYQSFGLDGIYGIPIAISSTYVVLFIILGTFMEFIGVGDLIMDLGKLVAGGTRGGPAKVATLTSALFGTLSGSAAANVYTTGTFTIPMMKRLGFKPHFAGAVEAAASSGGQIMPPIMGAAAFIMADLLGIPYIAVCKAALIPAFLYFTCLFFSIDFEAAKTGIKGLDKKELPRLREVIPRIYLLLPLVILLIFLVLGYSAYRAAFMAILATLAISLFKKETRFTPKTFLEALVTASRRAIMIAAACATAGLITGVITLTGIGLKISSVIMSISGGNMILTLFFIMIASIIMGMGVPTTVSYIIVVTLAAPTLAKLGFSEISSHLYVFYFGVLAMITPPVAIAAYAAADVADDEPMKIGFTACRVGIVAFIVPYVFLFDGTLLMEGYWLYIILRLIAILAAVSILAGSLTGWYFKRLHWSLRLLGLLMSFLIIYPSIQTTIIGIVFVVLYLFVVIYRHQIKNQTHSSPKEIAGKVNNYLQ